MTNNVSSALVTMFTTNPPNAASYNQALLNFDNLLVNNNFGGANANTFLKYTFAVNAPADLWLVGTAQSPDC